MTNLASDAAALGGSNPGETGAGASGGGPTGGGLAVPTDVTLMDKGGTLGDTASLDDADANSGTSLAEEGTTAYPQASTAGADDAPDGGVPTGGLSGAGTIGGSPTGTAASGMGGAGRLSDGGGLTE